MTDGAGASSDAAHRAGARVLVAEDEQHLGLLLEQFLVARGHRVARVRDGREALARLRAEAFDVAIVDVNMPGIDGLDVLRAVRALPLPPEVAVVTGHGTADTALQAMRLGAYDYLTKPYRMAEVETLVRRMHEKRALARQAAALRSRLACAEPTAELVTGYAPLRAVLAVVDRAATGGAPVLVRGEPGTGKALLARRIHERSGRDPAALAAADCRVLARGEDPVGALLGAAPPGRPGGLFAAAERGTVYLAHVDALPADAQARLLALLDGPADPDRARVVASSERDLAALAAAGRFDRALLDRLSAVSVELPPLRTRAGDVPLLVERFVREADPTGATQVAASALAALERAPWPGNVDELRAVVVGAVARARGGIVDAEALGPAAAGTAPPVAGPDPTRTLAALEREQVERALVAAGWHQGRAAAALGISPRTLYRKMRAYGLTRGGRNAS